MKETTKNILIVILCGIIVCAIGLSAYTIAGRNSGEEPNPNVTLVTVPDQADFEEHPEWTVPETEPIDYGENIALEKPVKQSGQTDIYNCKNVTDGDRYTYWEGETDDYPNDVTIDMGEVVEMSGARILLNPRAIWRARTQEVEVQVSDDGETFATVYPKTTLSFDPTKDNSAYMAFSQVVQGRYIRFVFYSNTGARGGQAAEIEVYGP